MNSCARPHVLVTGASSGIGRATVACLAVGGHHVYAGVRRPADGASVPRPRVRYLAGRNSRRMAIMAAALPPPCSTRSAAG